ncbi:MAG TPA: hypothetical protein VMD52_07315 [Patescibacteria group bacterium]|nr:hypothetical protein [Patescibacteria group bacterium]
MSTMSSMRRDFVATNLRSQLNRLTRVLGTMEEGRLDCDHAYESLREIEVSLRQIRKLCGNN